MVLLAPKYELLLTVLKKSAKTVAGRTAPSEVADLQRRAIASLQECADVALLLSECLGDAACPRHTTCLHLGNWNRCDSCFNGQVSCFFDQANKFMTAIAATAEPGPRASGKAPAADSDSRDAFPERTASFTEAQQRVFKLLMTGMPNKLIAHEIGVSEATIKAHVSAVLRKLKVRSRTQALALSFAVERKRNVQSTSLDDDALPPREGHSSCSPKSHACRPGRSRLAVRPGRLASPTRVRDDVDREPGIEPRRLLDVPTRVADDPSRADPVVDGRGPTGRAAGHG
jgi:DNA-binding CsgD family transcriptional regulator